MLPHMGTLESTPLSYSYSLFLCLSICFSMLTICLLTVFISMPWYAYDLFTFRVYWYALTCLSGLFIAFIGISYHVYLLFSFLVYWLNWAAFSIDILSSKPFYDGYFMDYHNVWKITPQGRQMGQLICCKTMDYFHENTWVVNSITLIHYIKSDQLLWDLILFVIAFIDKSNQNL